MQDRPARDQSAAIAAVKRRMAEKELSVPQLAKRAGVAANTIRSFLAGGTQPIMATMGKIEKVLDWPPGHVEDLALGAPPRTETPGVGAVSPEGITIVTAGGRQYTLKLSDAALASLEGKSALEIEEILHSAAAEAIRVAERQRRSS